MWYWSTASGRFLVFKSRLSVCPVFNTFYRSEFAGKLDSCDFKDCLSDVGQFFDCCRLLDKDGGFLDR